MRTSLYIGCATNMALAVATGSRLCLIMSISFGLMSLVVSGVDMVRLTRRAGRLASRL